MLSALTTLGQDTSFWGAHQVSRMVTVLSGSLSEPGTHASGQCMRYMSRYSQPRSLMDCWQDVLKSARNHRPVDTKAMGLQASGMRAENVRSCSIQGTRLCTGFSVGMRGSSDLGACHPTQNAAQNSCLWHQEGLSIM